MKKLLLLPVIAFACGISLPAQTLKIFHKSHAGTGASFTAGDFDVFGATPEMLKERAEALRKEEEEKKKKEGQEAKRKSKDQKKQLQKDEKDVRKMEREKGNLEASVPTPEPAEGIVTDPPAVEESAVAPAAPDAPVAPKAKPVKLRKASAPSSAAEAPTSAEAVVATVGEEPVATVTVHERHRQSRMGWLYGIVGLTIVPTLVFASGAVGRRKSSPTA